MQQVGRKRFLIIAIVCAVLLSIAAFSASWAKWSLGADSSATAIVNGNANNFYVEYPQYVAGSGESQIVIPQLQNGKYYMQVPQRGNTGTADFYEFEDHNDTEKKLESVYLYQGDVLSMYLGKTSQSISAHNGGNSTCGAASTNNLTLSNGKYTVNSEGFYNFYYVFGERSFWVDYIGKPSVGDVTAPTRDTSKNSVKIKFTDTTIVFILNPAINGYDTGLYIVNSNNEGTPKPGLKMSTGSDVVYTTGSDIKTCNTIELGFSYKNVDKIILYALDGSTNFDDQSNKHTGKDSAFYNALFSKTLQPNYTYTIKPPSNAHWNDFSYGDTITENTLKTKFTVSGTSGGSSGTNPADGLTAASPNYVGTTDFHTGSAGQEQTLNDKKTVRKVTSGAQAVNNKYIYKNYICVSRKNSSSTDDDNTTAYLEFEVTDSTINPYDVRVASLTLKRRATDANGNIQNSFVDPAPRIYNYDPHLDTRLGPDSSDNDYSNPNKEFTDADIAAARKPLFALGKEHRSFESNAGHMKYHYDDGVYAVLYFGDDDQQYFALDIEIELELVAGVTVPDGGFDFTLAAKAANQNSWERYADGYGEPWGYYMGGLINSVDTWDPSRTLQLQRANDRYNLPDPSYESQVININTATDSQIDEFNARTDFNYKLIKFYKETGAVEGYARYPKDKIDVSLTVNLTEGSLIKMYMLDHDGDRKNGNTLWIIPNEIIYDAETKLLFRDPSYEIYDEELNTIIPKTGTYIFRLVGYFHTRDEEIEDSQGNILKGDQICFEDGKRYETIPAGKTGTGLPNFNLWVDTLYITCSNAGEGNSECTITLNATNGAQFDSEDIKDGDTATTLVRKVTFGSDIKNLPKPKHPDGKTLLGWYYLDGENAVDFDFGSPVTGDLTLYSKWAAEYKITFNPNGGDLPSGVSNVATTDKYGNLTTEQFNQVKPTRSGYKFLGWYSVAEQTGGKHITVDTTFTADRTVYARWEAAAEYTVTFNINGAPIAAIPAATAYEGEKVAQPTVTWPTHYTFVNWNTKADGTGTAFDFTKAVTANADLYAYYKCDDGVYINGIWAQALTGATTEVYAKTVTVSDDNSVVTAWYNEKQITNDEVKNNYFKQFYVGDGLNKGVYDFYYKPGNYDHGLWIECYYIITFDANEGVLSGDAEAIEVITAKADTDEGNATLASARVPADPTRTGYRFVGWYTAANDGTQVTSPAKSYSASATLYAHWAKQYTVTFIGNQGTWSGNIGQKDRPIDENTKVSDEYINDVPTRSGYRFKGWYTAAEGGSLFDFDTVITAEHTVYAQWDKAFTVTFNANGSGATVTPTSATTNADTGKLSSLPKPTRTGYRFVGWFTAASGGNEVTVDNAFDADITLYAQWDKAFTVTFNANGSGATVTPTSATTDADTGKLASLPTPTRTGYRFDGWYTEAEGGNKVELNNAYNTFSDDDTLYAHWTRQYTVTFDANGGAWSDESNPHTQSVVIGECASEPLATDRPNAPSSSLAFDFWADKDGNEFDFSTPINDDITLYAQWKEIIANTYTVTYSLGDMPGTLSKAEDSVTEGSVITTAPTAVEIKGHSISSWYTVVDGVEKEFTFNATTISGDTTVYAKLTGAAYSINGNVYAFDNQTGTHGGNTEDESFTYIDTRSGKFSTGKLTIKVYYDGIALTEPEEDNQRVTHDANSDEYTIADASDDSCYGAFKIGAHRYKKGSTFDNFTNIAFYGGNIVDQLDKEVAKDNKVAIANKGGWYVVGQPSDWKFYEATKMTATNVEGIFSVTLKFVLPGEEYKIVYVPNTVNSQVTWYGASGSSASSAANMTIGTNKTFYVDEFKKDASGMFPTDINIYRIIFDKSAITWSSFGEPVQIHYWDANIKVGSDSLSNWTGNNTHSGWSGKKTMTKLTGTNYYYYDIPVVTYSGKTTGLSGVIILFKENSSVMQSQDLELTYTSAHSYKFIYKNWGASLGATWNGSNWWAVQA